MLRVVDPDFGEAPTQQKLILGKRVQGPGTEQNKGPQRVKSRLMRDRIASSAYPTAADLRCRFNASKLIPPPTSRC